MPHSFDASLKVPLNASFGVCSLALRCSAIDAYASAHIVVADPRPPTVVLQASTVGEQVLLSCGTVMNSNKSFVMNDEWMSDFPVPVDGGRAGAAPWRGSN